MEKPRTAMTEDRIKAPCLHEKGKDGKRTYFHRQWVQRFKEYKKKKMQFRHWTANQRRNNNPKRPERRKKMIQQDLLRALGIEATHQKIWIQNGTGQIKTRQIIAVLQQIKFTEMKWLQLETILQLGTTVWSEKNRKPLAETDWTRKRFLFSWF